jgi:hypothetical protein
MNFIRKFLFICLLIIGLASFSGNGHAKSWKGRMVDKETGQPIEGVAVAMTIHMVTATPAGGVSSFKRQIETFSGENGSFKASNYNLDLHLPVLQGLEYRYSAYKPGYKFLFSFRENQYRSPSILDALIDTLIYDPHPDVRTEAAIVLKQNKEPDAVARLIEHLQDNSSLVKQMSAWVMGAYPRDQSIVRALSSILDDDDVDVLKRVRVSSVRLTFK